MKWGRGRWWGRRRETDTTAAREALEATRRQQAAVRPLVEELRHRADQNRFAEKMRAAMGGR